MRALHVLLLLYLHRQQYFSFPVLLLCILVVFFGGLSVVHVFHVVVVIWLAYDWGVFLAWHLLQPWDGDWLSIGCLTWCDLLSSSLVDAFFVVGYVGSIDCGETRLSSVLLYIISGDDFFLVRAFRPFFGVVRLFLADLRFDRLQRFFLGHVFVGCVLVVASDANFFLINIIILFRWYVQEHQELYVDTHVMRELVPELCTDVYLCVPISWTRLPHECKDKLKAMMTEYEAANMARQLQEDHKLCSLLTPSVASSCGSIS
ncbi:hypothetical protein QVD17_17499 [Tagetes erecta]|uniref:Uncharacterized protein n=1 Tax=Tagetes erecta TaxID=13708 RepID=A0AAD8KSC4_TARER|nr:hypothetical protein QVD17_17499 [Tagetes erecta]